jgi:hypothetical protein
MDRPATGVKRSGGSNARSLLVLEPSAQQRKVLAIEDDVVLAANAGDARYSVREVDFEFGLQPITHAAFVPGAPSLIDLGCSPGDAIET